MAGEWKDYEWILVCGCLVAFFMAWSIGANDVANSFATSVGSKSITIFQAIVIAACCEFTGAMLLGGQVVKTIAGGIADLNAFVEDPEFLAFGMLCALSAAASWVTIATYFGMAVSTTHSIIGGIVGYALVYKGSDAVLWYQKAIVVSTAAEYKIASAKSNYVVGKDQVPIRGMVVIVLSWFTSPVCSALIATIHFMLVRHLVLRRKNALQLSFWALPIVVLYCIFMNTFFVVYKGGRAGVCTKGKDGKDESDTYSTLLCETDITGAPVVRSKAAAWIAAIVGGTIAVLVAIIVAIIVVPIVIARSKKLDANGEIIDISKMEVGGMNQLGGVKNASFFERPVEPSNEPWYMTGYKAATYGMTYDIHAATKGDKAVAAVVKNAEKFDPRAEQSFRPVQVFTSACVSFAHGSNDVANAVGPLAAIFTIYKTRTATSSADMPTWILALGAFGIVVGLSTYGYNIMRVLGTEMVYLSPSRGFSAELATAMVVAVGSMYGFPLSTTHCQTGSTLGVGLCEGGAKGVNWMLFLKQFFGWVITLIVAGSMSAALFAFAIFAPSFQASRDLARYEQSILDISTLLVVSMDATHAILKRDIINSTLFPNDIASDAVYTPAFEKNYLDHIKGNLSMKAKTYFQPVTLKDGSKVFRRKGVLTSQSMTALLEKTVIGFKNSSVLTFGSPFSQGTGWNKSDFQLRRGSDFAKLQ